MKTSTIEAIDRIGQRMAEMDRFTASIRTLPITDILALRLELEKAGLPRDRREIKLDRRKYKQAYDYGHDRIFGFDIVWTGDNE